MDGDGSDLEVFSNSARVQVRASYGIQKSIYYLQSDKSDLPEKLMCVCIQEVLLTFKNFRIKYCRFCHIKLG